MRGNRDRDNHSQFETVGLMYCNNMLPMLMSVSWWKTEEDIFEQSKNVFINQDGVKKLAQKVIDILKRYCKLQIHCNIGSKYIRHSNDFPYNHDYRCADWLFVLNALNFSLYTPKSSEHWTFDGFEGYLGLCCAMRKSVLKQNKFIWNPHFYVNMTLDELKEIFLGDNNTCIPLIEERLKILHDIGRILIDKFKGTFITCMKGCENDARYLIQLITTEFQCYQDKVIYHGKEVCLNTKAKTLIKDLEIYYNIKYTASFKISTVSTIFADIRCFKILDYFNVIYFSKTFEEKLKTYDYSLCHGSAEELEVRSCSIVAIERVCDQVRLKFMYEVTSDVLDFVKPYKIPILVDNILFLLVELDFNNLESELFCNIIQY